MEQFINRDKIQTLFKDWNVKNFPEIGKKYYKIFIKMLKEQTYGKYLGYYAELNSNDDNISPMIIIIGSLGCIKLIMNSNEIKQIALNRIYY
jgi:hypothetical protein